MRDRAKEDGVPLELDVWHEIPHVWHEIPHVWHPLPQLPEGDPALADIADFLARVTGVD